MRIRDRPGKSSMVSNQAVQRGGFFVEGGEKDG